MNRPHPTTLIFGAAAVVCLVLAGCDRDNARLRCNGTVGEYRNAQGTVTAAVVNHPDCT